MSWVRIEDTTNEHPKHLRAGPAACWLWVCGIAYCQRQLSDGFIPEKAVPFLGIAKGFWKLTAALVTVNLFEKVHGGYLVHDYHDFNDTREQAIERKDVIRKQRRQAGLASGRSRATKLERTTNEPVERVLNPIPSHPSTYVRKTVRTSSADADFETFRQAYPVSRRVGGKPGLTAFQRSGIGRHGDSLATVLLALEQQKRSEQWQTPKLIPLMTTWLNQERWLQVLPESGNGSRQSVEWVCPHTTHCLGRHECYMLKSLGR